MDRECPIAIWGSRYPSGATEERVRPRTGLEAGHGVPRKWVFVGVLSVCPRGPGDQPESPVPDVLRSGCGTPLPCPVQVSGFRPELGTTPHTAQRQRPAGV